VTKGLELSLVIPTYNDWEPLKACLASVAGQIDPPCFEVIVVDDGSDREPREMLKDRPASHELRICRQPHSGVAAARNYGLKLARSDQVLFLDADCQLERSCLKTLVEAMGRFPGEQWFQLRIDSEPCSLVGCAEALRLQAIQEQRRDSHGTIRWLNTAGFAIRLAAQDRVRDLFEAWAIRGQDTLLLLRLLQKNVLPRYVPSALVFHHVALGPWRYMCKRFLSSYRETGARLRFHRGCDTRLGAANRAAVLAHMWRLARTKPAGRAAFCLLLGRRLMRALGHLSFRIVRYSRCGLERRRLESSKIS